MSKQKGLIKRPDFFIVNTILLWSAFTAAYFFLKQHHNAYISGILSLVGESGLDLVAAFLAFYTWKHKAGRYKLFFLLLAISFLSAFVADIIYNYMLNIKEYALTKQVDFAFDLPFAFFLFFQAIAWLVLFYTDKEDRNINFASYWPYVLASVLLTGVFFFGINWKIRYLSVIGVYQLFDTFFEIIGFLLCSFCLVRANALWVKLFSSGYLIILASDFVIRTSVVESSISIANALETTWILGLLLFIIGFFLLMTRQLTKEAV